MYFWKGIILFYKSQDFLPQAQEPTPDGHRAPVLELTQIGSSSYGNHNGNLGNSNTAAITRTVDTQTPSQIIDSLSLNEETGLRWLLFQASFKTINIKSSVSS